MKKHITILAILIAFIIITSFTPMFDNDCECDKGKVEKIIKSKDFNRLPEFDDSLFYEEVFYKLSEYDNRILWYRDIENPEETKFTRFWNDYKPNNYHASQIDFVEYYKDKKDIELAFQFGPSIDLWAYNIFVIKKIDCCYLVTNSYFRHARFISKYYSIIDEQLLNSFFKILSEQKTLKEINENSIESYDYCGYFRDNRNKKSFYINFEKDQLWINYDDDTTHKSMQIRPEIQYLWDFLFQNKMDSNI
jgi:hypothetical protein